MVLDWVVVVVASFHVFVAQKCVTIPTARLLNNNKNTFKQVQDCGYMTVHVATISGERINVAIRQNACSNNGGPIYGPFSDVWTMTPMYF